jgi:hypothetical protein
MDKNLPLTELDFFKIKSQFKNFLKNDPFSTFKDYNFEGSNMSVLLDVLSYNTYQNNFYTNMALSEMFLDSAQLENSVISHAKELNYLPRSMRSAVAVVDLTITTNTQDTLILIPKYTKFTTTHSGRKFDFYTNEAYIATRIENKFIARNVYIYEGTIIRENALFTTNTPKIRLLNSDVDTNSIRVYEKYDDPINTIEYLYRSDIFGVTETDYIFYLEPSFDNTYELIFGNNVFGRTPPENERISIFYRTSSGDIVNGAKTFNTAFLGGAISVKTVTPAFNGANRETLKEIKFFAPKSIQIQERAVSETDYEILLKRRFNEIEAISVFGGDELEPPRFGRVAVSINVAGGLTSSNIEKYKNYLATKVPLGIDTIFIEPEFMNVDLELEIEYNPKITNKSKSELETLVRSTLTTYANQNLNDFGSIFELSRVSPLIDSLDLSILNNTMRAKPYILYSPRFNFKQNPSFNFNSSITAPCRFATANKSEVYNGHIRSSIFTYKGIQCHFEDNGLGSIHLIESKNRNFGVIKKLKTDIGKIDYSTGLLKLSDFIVDSYSGKGIKIYANTVNKNVVAPKNRILLLEDIDVKIKFREIYDR